MNMANGNSKVLTAEQEMQIRRPIEEYVGAIKNRLTVSGWTARIKCCR